MEAIFIVGQLQEKNIWGRINNCTLHLWIWRMRSIGCLRKWCNGSMRKLRVEDWLVRVVMAMYDGPKTSARVNGVQSEDFEVKVGVHHGSVLSPIPFIMVLEVISQEFIGR